MTLISNNIFDILSSISTQYERDHHRIITSIELFFVDAKKRMINRQLFNLKGIGNNLINVFKFVAQTRSRRSANLGLKKMTISDQIGYDDTKRQPRVINPKK